MYMYELSGLLIYRPMVHLLLLVAKVPKRDKKALANSVDPDETPHDATSHQGLRCLLKGISSSYRQPASVVTQGFMVPLPYIIIRHENTRMQIYISGAALLGCVLRPISA
ncbi:hypothetical protein DPMN_038178 [Dreissena polymorpha]|uniref:Uncharacterized protein n=1 Tax=Dreissena polymorpha TaxID=45954 RepID=A0A9D4RMY6_DREPO|nr:hypothetical protein DPMN_038178 [Dreissena polymorpha]